MRNLHSKWGGGFLLPRRPNRVFSCTAQTGHPPRPGVFLLDIIRRPNTQIQTYITTSNVIPRQSTK